MTEEFSFYGILNTHSMGAISLEGELPDNLKVELDVIPDGTIFELRYESGGMCVFRETSAIEFLKIHLDQIPQKTIH